MRILATDPGETTGNVVLEWGDTLDVPVVVEVWECRVKDVSRTEWAGDFFQVLRRFQPKAIILEDYRVFASKAGAHIGQHLFTAELIGAIETVCSLVIPIIPVHRMQAAKKGRWPEARLTAKFPEWSEVREEGGHATDALRLGLAWLEQVNLWTP